MIRDGINDAPRLTAAVIFESKEYIGLKHKRSWTISIDYFLG